MYCFEVMLFVRKNRWALRVEPTRNSMIVIRIRWPICTVIRDVEGSSFHTRMKMFVRHKSSKWRDSILRKLKKNR